MLLQTMGAQWGPSLDMCALTNRRRGFQVQCDGDVACACLSILTVIKTSETMTHTLKHSKLPIGHHFAFLKPFKDLRVRFAQLGLHKCHNNCETAVMAPRRNPKNEFASVEGADNEV